MEETKAPEALTESKNYSVKLILGSSPEHEPCVVDITKAVLEAVPENIIFDEEEGGIAYNIIGIKESVNGEVNVEVLDTPRADIFKMQDITHVMDASIVNANQRDAILRLIGGAIRRRNDDRLAGCKTVLSEIQ